MKQTRKQSERQEMSVESIIAGIDDRIGLLQEIKVAVRYAFTGAYIPVMTAVLEDEARLGHSNGLRGKKLRATKAKAKGATASPTAKPRGGRKLFIAVLRAASQPMSPDEIYGKLKARGWQTSSKNPRGLVNVVLRTLGENGKARRVGSDWEIAPEATEPAAQALEQAAMEPVA